MFLDGCLARRTCIYICTTPRIDIDRAKFWMEALSTRPSLSFSMKIQHGCPKPLKYEEQDRHIKNDHFGVACSVALLAPSLLLRCTLFATACTDNPISPAAFPALEMSRRDPLRLESGGRRGRGRGGNNRAGCLLRSFGRLKSLIHSVSGSTKDGGNKDISHQPTRVENALC